MNTTQKTIAIVGFILLALLATNPSIEDHREGVKEMYKKKLGEMKKDKKDDLATQIGTGIGMLIGDGFIDKIVSRENYLLFSLTKVIIADKKKNIGIGILGQVFVQDYEKIKTEIGGDGLVNESETIESDKQNDLSANNNNVTIKEVYLDEPKENINTDINDENIYKNVDIEAEFPRGIKDWTRYITREIERNIDELQDDGLSGTVVINFVVDKEGNVSEVHALTCEEAKDGNCLSPNSKLAEISVNAIRKGPKWVPAQLNGLVVKSYKRRPVTFYLSNN